MYAVANQPVTVIKEEVIEDSISTSCGYNYSESGIIYLKLTVTIIYKEYFLLFTDMGDNYIKEGKIFVKGGLIAFEGKITYLNKLIYIYVY